MMDRNPVVSEPAGEPTHRTLRQVARLFTYGAHAVRPIRPDWIRPVISHANVLICLTSSQFCC